MSVSVVVALVNVAVFTVVLERVRVDAVLVADVDVTVFVVGVVDVSVLLVSNMLVQVRYSTRFLPSSSSELPALRTAWRWVWYSLHVVPMLSAAVSSASSNASHE